MLKKLISVLIFVLFTFSSFAKATEDPFVITKVTSHVYIAHPGFITRVNSTSTIIVGETFLTVIESQTDSFMAATLITAIRKEISLLPIRYLIFSHSHFDHITGASAFVKENPSIIIIAEAQTARHIASFAENEQRAWAEVVKKLSIEAMQKSDSAINNEQKKYLIKTSGELKKYYVDMMSSAIVLPNVSFYDSLNLYDKNMQIQLRSYGGGHTASDIVVFIPGEKVLITGDLVHDFEPLFGDANPDSWIQVLEKIKQIDFDYFVGGHGDMHQGKIILIAWLDYLKELKTKTVTAISQGLTLEAFKNSITAASFTSLQNGYAERIQRFRTSYMNYLTGPLDNAIKDEITSLWKFYYHKN